MNANEFSGAPWSYSVDAGIVREVGGRSVVFVASAQMDDEDAFGEAGNATKIGHLVAAAPELVKALELGLQYLIEPSPFLESGDDNGQALYAQGVVQKIKDALAKSRGEKVKTLPELFANAVAGLRGTR